MSMNSTDHYIVKMIEMRSSICLLKAHNSHNLNKTLLCERLRAMRYRLKLRTKEITQEIPLEK